MGSVEGALKNCMSFHYIAKTLPKALVITAASKQPQVTQSVRKYQRAIQRPAPTAHFIEEL